MQQGKCDVLDFNLLEHLPDVAWVLQAFREQALKGIYAYSSTFKQLIIRAEFHFSAHLLFRRSYGHQGSISARRDCKGVTFQDSPEQIWGAWLFAWGLASPILSTLLARTLYLQSVCLIYVADRRMCISQTQCRLSAEY